MESEMMAHIPMFLHPHPRHVLVLGGDELSAREVVRHSSVESCARMPKPKEIYDVICVNMSTGETNLADEFYANLKTILTPNGIIVSKAASPFHAEESQRTLACALKKRFSRVHFYNFADEAGGLQSIAYASDSIHPIDDLSRSRVAAAGLEFYYYNLGIHEAAFLLPEFQKKNLVDFLNPL